MTLIKVVTNGYGISNLVSAETETTEKLMRLYKTASNDKTTLRKVITNGFGSCKFDLRNY